MSIIPFPFVTVNNHFKYFRKSDRHVSVFSLSTNSPNIPFYVVYAVITMYKYAL